MGFSMFAVVHTKAYHRKCLALKVSMELLVYYGSVYVSCMLDTFIHLYSSESVDVTEYFSPNQ